MIDPNSIHYATDAMTALAAALAEKDVDALEAIQRVVEGWMQTEQEAMAWRVLTSAMIDAACELIDLED